MYHICVNFDSLGQWSSTFFGPASLPHSPDPSMPPPPPPHQIKVELSSLNITVDYYFVYNEGCYFYSTIQMYGVIMIFKELS